MADEVAASKIPVTFIGFLIWESVGYDSQIITLPCKVLGDKVSAEIKWNLSRTAIELITEVLNHDAGPLSLPTLLVNSIASIFKTELPRQFSKEPNLRQSGGQALSKSIEAAREKKRLFPAPRGLFIS